MKKNILLFCLIPIIFSSAQSNHINLDEDISDWQSISVAVSDEQFVEHVPDFKELKITNDQNYLYFLVSFYDEILFQENNLVTLYIDADNNNSTGLQFENVGAELKFIFGQRSGQLYVESSTSNITHADIGLVSSPTVTSDIFEIAISRFEEDSTPFDIDTLKILWSGGSGVADLMPNDGNGYEYVLQDIEAEFSTINLEKVSEDDLRILCYNAHRDDIFDPTEQPAFKRQLQAINPDIIGFQEIYDHSAEEVAALMSQWLDGEWYHSKTNPDIITISRFPIIMSENINGNGAFLIDLNTTYGKELLIVNAHTPCCRNDIARQDEMDEFMAFVRDSKNQSGSIPVKENTPIVILGDMNMVGFSEQQRTLLNGEIKDNNKYGPDFNPDWDETPLEDSKPWATGRPMQFTWYNEFSDFSPGRLDYIVYSGSVMQKKNSFVLFTKGLTDQELIDFGLQANDNANSSDHLPLVADFDLSDITNVGSTKNIPNDIHLAQNYPNPFNPVTTIEYTIPIKGTKFESNPFTQIKIYDTLGDEITTLVNQYQKPGNYSIEWNAKNYSTGIYYYQLKLGIQTVTKKLLLLK